jgi:prephenate dehydratase
MPETPNVTYSFLGPVGTFTEAALAQVPEAQGKPWRAVNNVGEAFADVLSGRSVAAMIAIENSVDGGVSATQDALAGSPDLRIIGEYLVPVNFVLVARPGTTLADVKIINAHPVAYAQCRNWLESTLPQHGSRTPRRMPPSPRLGSRSTTTSSCSPRTSATTPTR